MLNHKLKLSIDQSQKIKFDSLEEKMLMIDNDNKKGIIDNDNKKGIIAQNINGKY